MNLSPNTNQYRIVEPERLMSSDPKIEVRHKLVRQYRPIAINDAKVGRIVLTVVDPSLGSQQCVCGSLCAKGLSSLDYLAGRIHFDNEYRQAGDHGFISLANPLRNAYQRLRSRKTPEQSPPNGEPDAASC